MSGASGRGTGAGMRHAHTHTNCCGNQTAQRSLIQEWPQPTSGVHRGGISAARRSLGWATGSAGTSSRRDISIETFRAGGSCGDEHAQAHEGVARRRRPQTASEDASLIKEPYSRHLRGACTNWSDDMRPEYESGRRLPLPDESETRSTWSWNAVRWTRWSTT